MRTPSAAQASPVIFLVHARHDLHQGGLAGAVDAHDADLGAGIEGQPDILQHLLAARIGLGQTFHHIDELRAGHLFDSIEETRVLGRDRQNTAWTGFM